MAAFPINYIISKIMQGLLKNKSLTVADYISNYPSKRGRRPRAFNEMGEFDLSLIREFQSRPSFYDKNSPRFKDKVYTAREWQEISNKLGYDVSLLKDRMLQLRNRYNLEKRRLEQLKEENPGKHVESPWPLYQHLHFLSKHIRARRSYKRQCQQYAAVEQQVCTSPGGGEFLPNIITAQMCQLPTSYVNGLVAVKMEEEDSKDGESESDTSAESEKLLMPANQPTIVETNLDDSSRSALQSATESTARAPSISIRRLDTMQHRLGNHRSVNTGGSGRSNHSIKAIETRKDFSLKRDIPNSGCSEPSKPAGTNVLGAATLNNTTLYTGREKKYAAFGSFITSSLLELPPNKALLLIEKFTSELVQVLIKKDVKMDDTPTSN